ncbi:MAG: GWxTD domain-containing protein, partial [Candidatus Aminicenantes bacterium]|nr:GWxTD domain-containing protein [Candidatus Aminicenantes bacterium]
LEYYKRLSYVKTHLGGTRSDQGKIYLILGEPKERINYTGGERVVDSEIWTYYGEGRPGLPPVMNLLFYRRDNTGNYRLFYPGMDSALDILSPGFRSGWDDPKHAYEDLRRSYIELADATLSVIPGEGVPGMPATSSLSSHVFAQIYTLPEKEASDTYLRGFQSLEGTVDVTYSFKELPGTVYIALSENRGFRFLNYSVLPENIKLVKIAENLHSAKLNLNLRIETPDGRTVYQQERNIEFKLDDLEKKALEEKKMMFSGFAPVITGVFNVTVVLSNTTTEEFLTHEERLELSDKTVPVILGFKTDIIQSDRFFPFSSGNQQISVDPRSVYNKTDSLEGLIFTGKKPDIRLIRAADEKDIIAVQDIQGDKRSFAFKQPLSDISSSNYYLSIKIENQEVFRKLLAVLPFVEKRPETYEWSDPPSSGPAYNFEIATQYLNLGNIRSSLEYFEKLPDSLYTSYSIPIIAKAYYRNRDYEKAVSLLTREGVVKNYTVLFLLGNSCLELNLLEKAAGYFEQLRNYGDTVKINQVLGAVYLSLGEREKAKVHFDRAKEIESNPDVEHKRK